MIVVGALLLILGFVFGVHLLTVLGVVLLVVGAVMWAMGSVGNGYLCRLLAGATPGPRRARNAIERMTPFADRLLPAFTPCGRQG